MTKITVELTEDQIHAIIRDMEFEMIDADWSVAFEKRIVAKLRKSLAKAKTS